MSDFRLHKRQAEGLLSAVTDRTPPLCIRALQIIIELCEAGLKLERDTEKLQKEIESLKKLEAELSEKEEYASNLELMSQELKEANADLKRQLQDALERY